ncbi:hypothetical protein MN608_05868 [Microdochium nivale]|nr:hypothetical protein MN608_05868 [Microdochium nivale]
MTCMNAMTLEWHSAICDRQLAYNSSCLSCSYGMYHGPSWLHFKEPIYAIVFVYDNSIYPNVAGGIIVSKEEARRGDEKVKKRKSPIQSSSSSSSSLPKDTE